MFEHYLEVGGVPIINSEATEAYARNIGPQVPFRPAYNGDRIHIALEEPAYRSPLIDGAPWANDNDLTSEDFFGLYPLDIEGIGDSTLSAGVTQHMDAGGSVEEGRDSSRTIKVTGLLIGASARAAQLGLTWLRAAVRSDDCDGGDCGVGGMSYFLAEPQISEHSWTDEVGSLSRSFGGQQVGRVSYRWTADDAPLAMPARARWELVATEGTSVRFGSRARYGAEELDSVGPVQPYRINYLGNPTVRADLSRWDLVGQSAYWFPSGGADAGSYGRVLSPGATQKRVYGSLTYGLGTYGTNDYAGGDAVQVSAHSVANLPAGPVIGSIALQGEAGQQVTLALVNAAGTVVAASYVKLTAGWARYSVTGTVPAGAYSLVATSSRSLAFDQALLEVGAQEFPYFDGGVPSGPDYLVSWEGVPDASRSIQTWNDVPEICRDDSDFRPFIDILQGSLSALRLRWYVRNEIPMTEALQPYLRTYYNVGCTQAPRITREFGDDSVGYFIQVEMLFEAGNPFAYSPPRAVPAAPVLTATFTDVAPVAQDDSWLVDPDCIQITPPPRAPVIFDDCIDNIATWQRYYVPIPAEDVADWASSVPTLRFDAKGLSIKQVRVRFHPNPFDRAPQQVDPTAFCSEFTISYLPALSRLEMNGATRQARASKSGKATVSANHLLYGTDGAPVAWPELTCGIAYVMTIDVPPSSDIDLFDLELELQRRE